MNLPTAWKSPLGGLLTNNVTEAFESRHDCKEVFKFLRLKASGLHKQANENMI